MLNSHISVRSTGNIVIVEDDQGLALTLKAALEPQGYDVTVLHDAIDVVSTVTSRHTDLLVLDMFLGAESGIDVLKAVRERRPYLPVIVMSGMGSIAMAVEAIKLGAAEFLEKPFPIERFVGMVERFSQSEAAVGARQLQNSVKEGLALLTGREHEVLVQIAQGASSKEAGRNLGISPRTVDVHRAHIKEKLKVRRAVDLVRLVYSVGDAKS
jgi:two-component system, LuxR family, response regulator FixJ